MQVVDSLLMKRRGLALKQKHPGSWRPPGPKTERLKKSRSQSALRRPKGKRRQRPPTCSHLRSCDGCGYPSNPCHAGPGGGSGISSKKAQKQHVLPMRARGQRGDAEVVPWVWSGPGLVICTQSRAFRAVSCPFGLSYGTLRRRLPCSLHSTQPLLGNELVFLQKPLGDLESAGEFFICQTLVLLPLADLGPFSHGPFILSSAGFTNTASGCLLVV